RVGRRGGNDDGVFQRAMLFELAHHVVDGRCLLADGYVHAGNVLALLADDGIDGNSGFTCLTIANDQLALATADRHHGVNCLDTGLQRLRYRFTGNNAGSYFFDDVGGFGVDWAFAIDGNAQRVNDAAAQFRSDRHFKNAASGFDRVAFRHTGVITQNNSANRVTLEVERKTEHV